MGFFYISGWKAPTWPWRCDVQAENGRAPVESGRRTEEWAPGQERTSVSAEKPTGGRETPEVRVTEIEFKRFQRSRLQRYS